MVSETYAERIKNRLGEKEKVENFIRSFTHFLWCVLEDF